MRAFGKILAIVLPITLLIAIPITVWYVSQSKKPVTEVRSKAADTTGVTIASKTVSVTGTSFPTLTGTGPTDATITLTLSNGTTLGTTKSSGSGDWSYTLGSSVPDGSYTITATATRADITTKTGSSTFAVSCSTSSTNSGVCDASCGSDGDCSSGFVCATVSEGIKRCRKPECTSVYNCVCPTSTPTLTPAPVRQVVRVTATPKPLEETPTPKIPVSGTGSVLGASVAAGGVLLLLLGLLL